MIAMGYVYFAWPEIGASHVKIGRAANYKKRLRSLGLRPLLLVKVGDEVRLEKQVHKHFKHLRCTGEWFEVTTEFRHFVVDAYFNGVWPYEGEVLKRA